MSPYGSTINAFNRHEIAFIVVGDTAAAMHGVGHCTSTMQCVIEESEHNVSRWRHASSG